MTDPAPLTIHTLQALVLQLTTATRTAGTRHVRPALLQQLRDAVTPDPGGTGRSKSPSERSVLNAAALDLYTDIDRRISEMYLQATGYNATIQAADELLFTWWTLLAVDNVTDPLSTAQLHNLHDTLDDLITRIRDLFESPNPIELKGRCPECGWSTSPHGRALIQHARPWREEISVTCRNCTATWTGPDAVKALAELLEHPALQLAEQQHLMPGHYDGDGCVYPDPNHFAPTETGD